MGRRDPGRRGVLCRSSGDPVRQETEHAPRKGDRDVLRHLDFGDVFQPGSNAPFDRMGQSAFMNFVFWPDGSEPASDVGAKAPALLAVQDSPWRVPPWFVLRPEAFLA